LNKSTGLKAAILKNTQEELLMFKWAILKPGMCFVLRFILGACNQQISLKTCVYL
jgi:hypothetical protein